MRHFVPPCRCSRRQLRLVRNSRSTPASLWLWDWYYCRNRRQRNSPPPLIRTESLRSTMRLTMKTYTDAGQLPLREVMDNLSSFSCNSRIDSRNLGATGQTVSQPVTETRELKTKKSLANTGESHHDSQLVTLGHEKSEWRREGDSNPRYGF